MNEAVDRPLVRMAVMQVRVMRVGMNDPRVPVAVAVGLACRVGRPVPVAVMTIVAMGVLVF